MNATAPPPLMQMCIRDSVTMQEDTQQIGEVVVTALGIKREKKMLGRSLIHS